LGILRQVSGDVGIHRVESATVHQGFRCLG
jgi:hypothetical protein